VNRRAFGRDTLGRIYEPRCLTARFLLGNGIRFSSPGLARIELKLVNSVRSGAATILRFRVRK
jgi:hypothetical protein